MLIGIVSDTHDNLDLVEAAVDTFRERGVDAVVHCGDVIAPFSAVAFDDDFAFYAVRGNNDGEWALRSTVEAFGTYLGEMGELDFDGRAVAVYHGTSEPVVDALVECGRYDFVFHGHTHERAHEDAGETVRINPGGIPFDGAPEPFHVAVLDTDDGAVEFVRPG